MIGKFFHTPKSKQFHIPYRYYDPEKEEMKDREQRIKKELGIKDEGSQDENYRATLKGSFRSAMDRSKTEKDARRSSNTRLIWLIMILSVVFYLLFFYF